MFPVKVAPTENATDYTTTPRQNKTPTEKSAGAMHQSTNNQLRLRRAYLARIRAEVVFHIQ